MSAEPLGKISLLLSSLLQKGGREADAIGVLEHALNVHPEDAEVGRRLASLYAKAGRFEEAADQCERLVRLNPRDIVALDLLAGVYARAGQNERLWGVVTKLLHLCPEEPRYRLLKAALLQQSGDTSGAMEQYLAVLDRDEEELSSEAAEEAVYLLDAMQIQRLLLVAQNDNRFRARLKRDLGGALREYGVHLSDGAQVWLEGLDIDAALDNGFSADRAEPLH